MSWSIGAVGKPAATLKAIKEQIDRGSELHSPEHEIRQRIGDIVEMALSEMPDNVAVRVSASGSQSSENYPPKPGDKRTNHVTMTIEPIYGFVE